QALPRGGAGGKRWAPAADRLGLPGRGTPEPTSMFVIHRGLAPRRDSCRLARPYGEQKMRLVTYRTTVAEQARLGAVVGDRVVDLARLGAAAGVPLPDDMLAFIDLGPDAVRSTTELLDSYEGKWP